MCSREVDLRPAAPSPEPIPSTRSTQPPGQTPPTGAHALPDRCSVGLVLVAFSITPLGAGEDVGQYVADAIRVVRASGLPNQTDSMFTTIEGDWDEVMAVIKEAVDVVAAQVPRVGLTLKADLRPGVTDAITSKVEYVDRYLSS